MASVRKRTWTHKGQQNEAWIVAYTDQGGKRRIKTFDRKKEADRHRLEVETEIEQGVHTPQRDTVTFKEACEGYYQDCERRRRIGDRMAGNTLYTRRSHIFNHLVPTLGNRLLTQINFQMLQDAVNGWAEKLAPSTLGDMASTVKLVLIFAVRRRWLKTHPLTVERLHIPGRRVKRDIPSKAELELILRSLMDRQYRETPEGHRNRCISVSLALFGGLRRGEVCGLQWENVDFEQAVIRIRHSLSRVDGLKEPKSRAGNRDVPMTDPMRKILLWARGTDAAKTGHVIRSRSGEPVPPSNIYWHWHMTMRTAGLVVPSTSRLAKTHGVKPKYPFHALRHAAVSLLIEQGLQPMHVKNFIGHHSVKTTFDIYGHLFPEDESSRIAATAAAAQFSIEAPRERASFSGRQGRDMRLQYLGK